MAVEGILTIRRALARPGTVTEERLLFSDLQGLLDLCTARAEGAAFVQVQVTAESDGRQRTLVLDFGHFGRAE
jgi:hypothetical protein